MNVMKLPLFILACIALTVAAIQKHDPPKRPAPDTMIYQGPVYGDTETDDRVGDDMEYDIQAEEANDAVFEDEWAVDEGDPEAETMD